MKKIEHPKDTITAIFPGIGPVEISRQRAAQIKNLQRIILEQRAKQTMVDNKA